MRGMLLYSLINYLFCCCYRAGTVISETWEDGQALKDINAHLVSAVKFLPLTTLASIWCPCIGWSYCLHLCLLCDNILMLNNFLETIVRSKGNG